MKLASSLRKTITKNPSSTTFFDFSDDDRWCTIGNYAANKLASGGYRRGALYGRSLAIGGMSGSGKSLIAATICAKAQKEDNALIVWLDVEKATTGRSGRDWLERIGVDTSEDALIYAEVATIEDVKSLVADIAGLMRKDKDPQPVIVVIDSLGMLMTEGQMEKAKEGEVAMDRGQGAKQRKDLITAITHLSSRLPLMTISILHTMASQDQYNPDEVITGGRGVEYAASQVFVVNRMKLRARQVEKSATVNLEDKEGNDVVGIRSKFQVYKSRFAQPNMSIELQVLYPHGLDPYSGLFVLMEKLGEIVTPSVGWRAYEDSEGNIVKFREKDFREHADRIMDLSDQGKLKLQQPTEDAGSE